MSRRRRSSGFGLTVAAGLCGWPGVGAAQPGALPDTRPPISEIVERLGSGQFAVRERAMTDLFNREDFTLQQAEWMLTDPSLSAEQRLRISRIALVIFARGPRAAMGIRFASPDDTAPARVDQPQPGFHAFEVLQTGDTFLMADGVPVETQGALRSAILSHSPGETLEARVLREGREVDVSIRLGSFGDLGNTAPPQAGHLLAAWRVRLARWEHDAREAPLEIVARSGDAPDRAGAAWMETFATPDAPPSLVMGGQARESVDMSLAQLQARDAARALAADRFGAGGDMERQLAALREQRGAMLDELRRMQARLALGQLDPPQRAGIERAIADMQSTITRLEQQIRVLDAALRGQPRR